MAEKACWFVEVAVGGGEDNVGSIFAFIYFYYSVSFGQKSQVLFSSDLKLLVFWEIVEISKVDD